MPWCSPVSCGLRIATLAAILVGPEICVGNDVLCIKHVCACSIELLRLKPRRSRDLCSCMAVECEGLFKDGMAALLVPTAAYCAGGL